MIHQYDHRFGDYALADFVEGRGVRQLPQANKSTLNNPAYEVTPRYWVPNDEVRQRLGKKGWKYQWVIGWRDITSALDERTVIASAAPLAGYGDKFLLVLPDKGPKFCAVLLSILSSIPLDYIARQKLGGTSLKYFVMKQLAVPSPAFFLSEDFDFIIPRVIERTFTSESMRPFAKDLGYDGPPFGWDPERRALLRAELDAYYAYLYGLTRRELEYILDPKDVMGPDYPSETFRVLKNKEIKEFGEYRTRRLVLEAWGRFVEDGTFDPARLRDPEYIDKVSAALTETRSQLAELQQTYEELLQRAGSSPLPTLFVEGQTDVEIVKAAWSVFHPDEDMPIMVLSAGGTRQMGSLAGKGKALREILGERIVCALADNDSEGRGLWDDGHFRRGGTWKQHSNGIHWCLLAPTEEFAAAMDRFQVPKAYRPFTIEACFPAAVRRRALEAGAYAFSGNLQSELFANQELAQRLFPLAQKLDASDDATFYLMAPTPEAKDAFAEWITRPENRTPENYAAFEVVLLGLREMIEQHGRQASPQGREQPAGKETGR